MSANEELFDGDLRAGCAIPTQLPGVLLHEFLHCAGASHSDDKTSVMYRGTGNYGQITDDQLRDLRRLSGMTPMQRLVAQIRAMF